MSKEINNPTNEHSCTSCVHVKSGVKGDILVSAVVVSFLINFATFTTWLVLTVGGK